MVFTELRYRFSQIGAGGLASKITELRGKQLALIETTHGLRTAYLYLAFGFLAAGAMMARAGAILSDIASKNIETFRSLEYQSTITANIMGRYLPGEISELQSAFSELGKLTEWTSTEAAEVGRIYALAGVQFEGTNDAIKTVGTTLEFATLAELGHTEAAQFAIDVTTMYRRELTHLGAAIDLIATAATSANLSFAQMSESMKYAGAAAYELRVPLADTAAFMMYVAEAGFRGTRAGRGFREGMTRLAATLGATTLEGSLAEEATNRLIRANEEGIPIWDEATGQFNGLANMVGVLNRAYGDLEPIQRAAMLRAKFGAMWWSAYSGLMKKTPEEIEANVNALMAAEAVWALQNKLGVEGKAVLLSLYDQYKACGGEQIEFGAGLEKLDDQERQFITTVLKGIKTREQLKDATDSVTSAHFLAQKRLETLHMRIDLYESSLERLHEVMGAAIAPQIQWIYDRLRYLIDALADMHPWILWTLAVVTLLGGALLSWGGQIMMVLGGVFMLVAALAILVAQREAHIKTILYEQNTLRGLNITYAQASAMAAQTTASTFNLRTGFQLLALQLGITSASFGLLMRSMMLHMTLAAIPMIISMGLIAEGAETQNKWFSRLGLITMFVLTPALQMLTLAQVRLTIAKVWDKIVTYGLITAIWLWIGTMAAASGALSILTDTAILFGAVSAPMWMMLLAIVAVIIVLIVLFKKWDAITEKLGAVFEKVFIKRRSPAFWEALKFSAGYAAENVKQFKALIGVSERFGRTGVARGRPGVAAGGVPAGGGAVQISMFEGARINLTKETMGDFSKLVDDTVDKVFAKLERVFE